MNMSEFVTPLKESSSAHADMTPKHIILKRQRHLYDACTVDDTEELRERKKLNRGITLQENRKRKFDVNMFSPCRKRTNVDLRRGIDMRMVDHDKTDFYLLMDPALAGSRVP